MWNEIFYSNDVNNEKLKLYQSSKKQNDNTFIQQKKGVYVLIKTIKIVYS